MEIFLIIRSKIFTLFLVILIAIFSLSASAQETHQPARVLIISLDGARPDALLQVAPRIQALAERGAFSWTAQTVFPPATLPAHASLLSSVDPSRHGYDDNVVRECGDFTETSILELAQDAGYRTAMVVGKAGLCQFLKGDETAFTFAREGDRSVVDGVLTQLDAGYEVIFAHFPNPDYFGHLEGWMSDLYLWELDNTDYEIGRLLDEIERRGMLDDMLITLTADHGGHGIVHGADIPEDMTIPWLMSGPGIRENYVLDAEGLPNVGILDVAPTVLWSLGIPIPEQMEGRVVCEAFEEIECDSTP